MKRLSRISFLIVIFGVSLVSCNYLDVVPDNIATVDNAFTMRSTAEKYLFTCYSYMPNDADVDDNPALMAGDEIWDRTNSPFGFSYIARGYQNASNPYGDRWGKLYKGLRDCNIFLENVRKVPDLSAIEKMRWIAEAKFLKAYYHFYLLRMYGPIPLVKENLSIDSDPDLVRVSRDPVDSCFSYIVKLIDEAKNGLPAEIDNPAAELGRITQPIALALKAKVLVTAASPLFNGNNDQAQLLNNDGTPLFNPTYSKEKWEKALVACKRAVDICDSVGFKLYQFEPSVSQSLTDTILTQLTLRNRMCERWNSEIIWANTQGNTNQLQLYANQNNLDPEFSDNVAGHPRFCPPLKVAEMFYTQNGVPIEEDKTWDYGNRYQLQAGREADQLYIRKDYTTAKLNFDREPRFYADLGFDGGVWYGQGRYNDDNAENLFYIMQKTGQLHAFSTNLYGTITGYLIKKYVHYENVAGHVRDYSINSYPWPIMRLAEVYLLYAEALNECETSAEALKYINKIRERAGLESVESSWSKYSSNPSKYSTQTGLREIIHRERLIELAFEGQRFWDLRRWKEATSELNKPIKGWNVNQETAKLYYAPRVLWNQKFGVKDYFWPIQNSYITQNRNIVQNVGW